MFSEKGYRASLRNSQGQRCGLEPALWLPAASPRAIPLSAGYARGRVHVDQDSTWPWDFHSHFRLAQPISMQIFRFASLGPSLHGDIICRSYRGQMSWWLEVWDAPYVYGQSQAGCAMTFIIAMN